jgi:hypothetical protein
MGKIVEMEKPKPQLLLPFAEKEYIDMPRGQRILGVSWNVLNRMAASGLIHLIEFRERGWKKIRYQSIVDHCDRLRTEYGIPDNRPQLSPMLRHRDEDLLPFPLRDTIGTSEALLALGLAKPESIIKICQEGPFWCYRVHSTGPWRISLSSFNVYLERTMRGVRRGVAYKIPE